MRKMIMLMVVLVGLVVLAGCGAEEKRVTYEVRDDDGNRANVGTLYKVTSHTEYHGDNVAYTVMEVEAAD